MCDGQLTHTLADGEKSAMSQSAVPYGVGVLIAVCVDCVPKPLVLALSASVGFQKVDVMMGEPVATAPSTPPVEPSGPRTALRE